MATVVSKGFASVPIPVPAVMARFAAVRLSASLSATASVMAADAIRVTVSSVVSAEISVTFRLPAALMMVTFPSAVEADSTSRSSASSMLISPASATVAVSSFTVVSRARSVLPPVPPIPSGAVIVSASPVIRVALLSSSSTAPAAVRVTSPSVPPAVMVCTRMSPLPVAVRVMSLSSESVLETTLTAVMSPPASTVIGPSAAVMEVSSTASSSSMIISPTPEVDAVTSSISVSSSIPVTALATRVEAVRFTAASLSSMMAPPVLVRVAVWVALVSSMADSRFMSPVVLMVMSPSPLIPDTPSKSVMYSGVVPLSLAMATPPLPPSTAIRSTVVWTASGGSPTPVAAVMARSGATMRPSPSRTLPPVDSITTWSGLLTVPSTVMSPAAVTITSEPSAVASMLPSPRTPGDSR